MSQPTLSERLRMMYIEAKSKNPGGIEGFDTPLLFEAISAIEAFAGAPTSPEKPDSSPSPSQPSAPKGE